MRARQLVFGWFEGGLNRAGVMTLNVFRPEVIRRPALGDWEVSDVGRERLSGGQHVGAAALSTWLKFWAPLSPTWQETVGGES